MKKCIGTTDLGANRGRTVAVMGGGIAGLAAALAFAKGGAIVTVYEQSDELREVGAGLQVTPNGARVLSALGLNGAADRLAIRAEAVIARDGISGKPVARFGLDQPSGVPYRFFHRADLLDMLAQAALGAGVRIETGHKCEGFAEGWAHFNSGAQVRADLFVGADGLHSTLRPVLNGADQPFFTGQVAWRSVVQVKAAPAEATIWMAPGKHVVTYPLPGGRLNIVAVQERTTWAAEGWSFFDEPSVAQAAFADCAPDLRALLDQMQTARLWGLFRHPVAQSWMGPGMAILGDAAHPTLPFLAQGANLALEDALVLARCCDGVDDLNAGLAAYQAKRRTRVARAIDAANRNAVNYHLSGARRALAHAGLRTISRIAPRAFLRRMDWLYGYDAAKA